MISVVTRAGVNKEHSEDAVLCGAQVIVSKSCVVSLPNNSFVAVADGVGGSLAGEVASTFVLSELSKCTPDDLRTQLLDINNRLITESNLIPEHKGMASTLTGVYLTKDESMLFHVGNTRAYTLQGKYLKQITSDHTVYNWLKSSGRHEEAAECNRNEITNCFGGGDSHLLERLQVKTISSSKTVLLTSDGVHEHISIDDMEEILCMDLGDLEKCAAIIEKALCAGSQDDLSVVLINASEEDEI